MRVFPTVASTPGRVLHYLAFLTNSFWHSYPFSVRWRCPLTQISLLLKEQPVLASRRASVWKEEVFQTLIQGLLELLPFGQALARSFTLSILFSGFLPLFCGATNTNWVVINWSMREREGERGRGRGGYFPVEIMWEFRSCKAGLWWYIITFKASLT